MFSIEEISQVCQGSLRGHRNVRVEGVSIDSRTAGAGDLFVAIRGARFDGHDFVPAARESGARAALVERFVGVDIPQIIVPDALKSLQRLASYHRRKHDLPAVAITGSVGKTTTKECIGAVLASIFRVKIGLGNWNNHIGVPLNLLSLSSQDQCLVVELGANHGGEIARLAQMAQPTVGVITGVHPSHLEGFGSLDGAYCAKLELADYLSHVGGTLIVNGDDPDFLRRASAKDVRMITFGMAPQNDFFISQLVARSGCIYFQVNGSLSFKLRGYGSFNALNALAAIAVAHHFNLNLKEISESWQALPAVEGRFQVTRIEASDVVLVDDTYNANPYSFRKAIESFHELDLPGRKVAIVGDMLELGEEASRYHAEVGLLLREAGFNCAIGVGPLSREVLKSFQLQCPSGQTHHFDSRDELQEAVSHLIQTGDCVLIKGSHGMKLNELHAALAAHLGRQAALT